MPVPKRRTTRSRRNKRRAHDHLTLPAVSYCPQCHEVKMPHQICPHCGFYRGKEIINPEEETA